MGKVTETLAACPHDKTPLIWTFMFTGAEYICPKCKCFFGMMEADSVEKTPELAKQLAYEKRRFRHLAKSIWSGGARKVGCTLCSEKREAHQRHLTPEEKTAHDKAWAKLFPKKEEQTT